MPRKPNETGLTVDVDKELKAEFFDTVIDGFKKKGVLTAALKLWVCLKPQARAIILGNPASIEEFAEFCSGHIQGRKTTRPRNLQSKDAKVS